MPHSQVIPGETSVIILDRSGRIECSGTGAQRLLGPVLGDCRHAADLLHACAPDPGGRAGDLDRWEDLSASRPGEPAASLPGRVDNNGVSTDILLRFLPLDDKVILTIGPLPDPPEFPAEVPATGPALITGEHYRLLFNSMTDAFVSVSIDGWIIDCNKAYQQLTGYNQEELSRLTYIDLTPSKWHEMEARIVAEQIIPCGHSEIYEKEYRCKDGSIVPIELHTFLVRDSGGNPASMWAIVRDATKREFQRSEQKRQQARLEELVAERTRDLHESEARFRQLADATSEAIAISHEGILLDVNRQFTEMFGCGHDKIIGRPCLDLIAPDYRDFATQKIMAGCKQPYELVLMRRDGTTFPAEVRGRMVPDRDRLLRVSAIRDLSVPRRLDAQIVEQRENLSRAHQIAGLAAIGAGIAHQIAQPLYAVINNVATTKAKISNCPQQPQCCGALGLINDLENDTSRMMAITNRIRALARPGKATREPVMLNDLLAEVLLLVRPAGQSNPICFQTDFDPDLPVIPIDRLQIAQVIDILLRNAIDAVESAARDAREILLATRRINPGTVEFSVSDIGPGIHPDHLPNIFGLFFTTKDSGTGVGLALAHRIVTSHGGTIIAANQEDRPGAHFRVRLPTSATLP